jgi:large subunit ribosomal protein L15
MSLLSQLTHNAGARKKAKRLGRGIGTGKGGTSGKGNKGQKARSGGKVRRGFEGGQMPMYRRMPKMGFVNPFRMEYAVVNLAQLNNLTGEVTPVTLKAAGLIKGRELVKILGNGKLQAKLIVKAHAFSETAKAAIEAAGGKVEVISK